MTDVNVLSPIGTNAAKTPGRRDAGSESAPAATGFAILMKGLMKPESSDTKGQSLEKRESPKEPSGRATEILKPVPVDQSADQKRVQQGVEARPAEGDEEREPEQAAGEENLQNLLAELTGYLFSMTASQHDFPVGKEANSGAKMNQVGGIAAEEITANVNTLSDGTPWAEKAASVLTRMMRTEAQGNSVAQTELDGYKEEIAQLLQELNGEIEPIPGQMTGQREDVRGLPVNVKGLRTAAGDAQVSVLQEQEPDALELPDRPPMQAAEKTVKPQERSETERPAAAAVVGAQAKARSGEGSAPRGLARTEPALAVALENTGKADANLNYANLLNVTGGAGLEGEEPAFLTAVNVGRSVAAQVEQALQPYWQPLYSEVKEVRIQLHPEDLGRILIAMKWENGQVHLRVTASEAATGTALQNNLHALKNTLENQGISMGSLQMETGSGEGAFKDSFFEGAPSLRPGEDEEAERAFAAALVGTPSGYGPTSAGDRLLDVTA